MEISEEQNEKLKKRDNLFVISSVGTLIICMFFMIWFMFSLFFPPGNLEVGEISFNGGSHAKHGHFTRGEDIDFRIGVCKITNVPVDVTIEMFDGDKDEIPLSSERTYSRKGCTNLVLAARIPRNAPLGRYNIRVIGHQNINNMRQEHDEVVIPDILVVDEFHNEEI